MERWAILLVRSQDLKIGEDAALEVAAAMVWDIGGT